MQTIREARVFIKENIEKGINCPCCGQYVKLYKMSVNSSLARALVSLVFLQEEKEAYIHISEVVKHAKLPFSCGKNICILKHWNLISDLVNTDTKKRASGYWAATEIGIDFVKGKNTIPRYKWVYNNKCRKTTGGQLSISDCLRNKFDYEELMGV